MKNKTNKIQEKFLNQRINLDILFNELQNSNDTEKIKIVDSFSRKELQEKYDCEILENTSLKYRLDTLERILSMCYDTGLIYIDLVIHSHYNAIIDRVFYLLEKE